MANQKIARTEKWMMVEITKILKVKAKNPKFADITITDAKLTNDLSYLTVTWYLYSQDQSKIDEIKQELEKVKGFCRKELSQISSAYKVPEIRFKYDETIDQADRIEAILAKLKSEE